MCQLTMVDMQHKEYLPNDTLRWLLSMNSKEGHMDGFGCYLWDKDFLVKTKEEASSWLRKNFRTEIYSKSINGIFHVRRASVKVAKDQIKDYHAHPFEEKGIVLAHNGTLTENHTNNHLITSTFDILDKEDVIDSQKFLRILNVVRGDRPLSADIIKEAMDYFYGSFAMLIYSKEQKDVYILRDAEKTLNLATFSIDKQPVGVLVNTKYYMLDVITEMLCDIIRKPVLMELIELPKESIFVYRPGTYTLVKIDDIKQTTRRYTTVSAPVVVSRSLTVGDENISTIGGITHYKKTIEGIVDKIIGVGKRIHLNFNDLCLLYELFFDESLLSADRENMSNFKVILEEIEKVATVHRIEKVEELAKLFPENNGIEFYLPFAEFVGVLNNYPPILNGKGDLTEAIDKFCKKGKILQ